jgi:hypothetical protein
MTALRTIAAAALLSAFVATPVFAQQAIQEPGAFAFYHPNLDVLNGGAPTPASKLANDPAAMQDYVARELGNARPRHHAYRAPVTETAPNYRALLYGSTF